MDFLFSLCYTLVYGDLDVRCIYFIGGVFMFKSMDADTRRYFEAGMFLQGRFNYMPKLKFFTKRVTSVYNSGPLWGTSSGTLSASGVTLYSGSTYGSMGFNFFNFGGGGGGGGGWWGGGGGLSFWGSYSGVMTYLGEAKFEIPEDYKEGSSGCITIPFEINVPEELNGKVVNIVVSMQLNGRTVDIPAFGLGIELITDMGEFEAFENPQAETSYLTYYDSCDASDSYNIKLTHVQKPNIEYADGVAVKDSTFIDLKSIPSPYLSYKDSILVSDTIKLDFKSKATPNLELKDSTLIKDSFNISFVIQQLPNVGISDKINVSDEITFKTVTVTTPFTGLKESVVVDDTFNLDLKSISTPNLKILESVSAIDGFRIVHVKKKTPNKSIEDSVAVRDITMFKF